MRARVRCGMRVGEEWEEWEEWEGWEGVGGDGVGREGSAPDGSPTH